MPFLSTLTAKLLGAGIALAALIAAFVAHGNHRYHAGQASMQPAVGGKSLARPVFEAPW